MRKIAASRLCGGLLVGLICGTALAQNNPGGPPDQAGTASNIPTPTGTPGTFNAQTGKVTSAQGKPGTPHRRHSAQAISASKQHSARPSTAPH
jgi:hypothetical protein